MVTELLGHLQISRNQPLTKAFTDSKKPGLTPGGTALVVLQSYLAVPANEAYMPHFSLAISCGRTALRR